MNFYWKIVQQAEKDAAMKQAESASRAAEMFMKVSNDLKRPPWTVLDYFYVIFLWSFFKGLFSLIY